MELTTLTKELYESTKRLAEGSKNLFELAHEKAKTEKIYREALMREIYKLREDKIPATLISDIARGNVAHLKFERDLAETRWTTARDSLRAIEAQQTGLQSILKIQNDMG